MNLRGNADGLATPARLSFRCQPTAMLGTKQLKRLGRDLTGSGRYEQAIVVFRDAIRLDAGDARLCDGLSYALYMSCRFEEAITWSEKALSLDATDYFAAKNIGLCLAQLGRKVEAVDHLRQSIALKSDYFDAHHDLAIVLMDLARWDEAKQSIEAARRVNPSRSATLDKMLASIAGQTSG